MGPISNFVPVNTLGIECIDIGPAMPVLKRRYRDIVN